LGGACFSNASRNDSHQTSYSTHTSAVVCVFFNEFLDFLLYISPHVYSYFCVWVIVTQYICQITFNSDPGFVASMPQGKGLVSSKALPPRSYIHSLNFRLPRPYCVCVFYFFLLLVSVVSKKKKKNLKHKFFKLLKFSKFKKLL